MTQSSPISDPSPEISRTTVTGDEDAEQPLAGIRIIDLTQYEAGPSATQLLAWLGADVVKIEPPGGEPSRSLVGADADRESIIFSLLNQNKRSVVLDLKSESDREILESLLGQADVLAQNFAPGTMSRLGIGIDELRARHPALVVASIRGYAAGGPWADFRSLDFVAQAVSGAISVTGEADRPPVRIGPTVADSGTGLHLAVGILAALLRRTRTGKGGLVEVSLQDAVTNLMRNAMAPMYVTGEPAQRAGDAFPDAVPSGLHPCAPGGANDYVFIMLSSRRQWEGLLRAIEREDLIGDPRYARQSARNAQAKEINEIVRAWTQKHDKHEVMKRISDFDVPCGATLDTCELLVNEQLVASGMIVEQQVPGWGLVRLPGNPIRIDGERGVSKGAPDLGADADSVVGVDRIRA